MKDATAGDMPRRASKYALTRGFPNGATLPDLSGKLRVNKIARLQDTQRTETSHVTVEKKSIEIPVVVASELGKAQTPIYRGVVGPQHLFDFMKPNDSWKGRSQRVKIP
jgi:hypothetical protein